MGNEMPTSDEYKLIAQARDDPAAFGELYDRYANRIFGFAIRQTHDSALAKDIVSATFEQALRHLRRYRWQNVSFGAWLYKIARNEIAQHYRQQAVRSLFVVKTPTPNQDDPEQHIELDQQHDLLHQALARLSRADQELIELRFFAELSSAEVAEILNCSVQKVYLRLHRALIRLRKHMDSMETTEEKIYASE